MGLFKAKYGGLRWKRIFFAIFIVIFAVIAYTIVTTGDVKSLTQLTKLKDLGSLGGLKEFMLTGTGLLRNLLVTAIIVAPLILQGLLGPFNKSLMIMLGASIGIIFYPFAESLPMKEAFYLAWGLNAVLLLVSTRSIKEGGKEAGKPLDASMAWIIFGLTSAVIAPFKSLISSPAIKETQLSSFWIYISLFGAFILPFVISEFIKIWKKASPYVPFFGKAKTDEDKAGDDNDKDKKNAKNENDIAANADKTAEQIQQGIIDNLDVVPAVERFQSQIQNASGIQPVQAAVPESLLRIIERQQELQAETTNRLFNILEDKDKYKATEVGRAQAYIYELGGRMLQEMKSKSSNWEEFERLRNSKFREVTDKLTAAKNKRLHSYAKLLEKSADKIGIKTFVGLCARWVKELNREREKFGETVEKESKALEKSGKEIRKIAEKIDNEYRAVKEQKEMLKRYDTRAREFYSEMQTQINEVNRADVDVDAKKRLIREMREKLRWIMEYLPNKNKILSELRKNFAEIEHLIEQSDLFTVKNGKSMKKLEEVNENIGAMVKLEVSEETMEKELEELAPAPA